MLIGSTGTEREQGERRRGRTGFLILLGLAMSLLLAVGGTLGYLWQSAEPLQVAGYTLAGPNCRGVIFFALPAPRAGRGGGAISLFLPPAARFPQVSAAGPSTWTVSVRSLPGVRVPSVLVSGGGSLYWSGSVPGRGALKVIAGRKVRQWAGFTLVIP